MALPLARAWHERGAYFTTVAGKLFELHATAADRRRLEAYVAANVDDDVGAELDALGRLGDPASIPLLVEVAATTPASRARTRAVRALSFVARHPLAQATLREALWDAEDEAAELACGTVAGDDEVRRRIAALAANPLADAELTARALARSSRW
jgi:HEAT repeat protein